MSEGVSHGRGGKYSPFSNELWCRKRVLTDKCPQVPGTSGRMTSRKLHRIQNSSTFQATDVVSASVLLIEE